MCRLSQRLAERNSLWRQYEHATFHLARALGKRWQAGDEIVVTELDHHANVAPWHYLQVERGISLLTVKMTPQTGQARLGKF